MGVPLTLKLVTYTKQARKQKGVHGTVIPCRNFALCSPYKRAFCWLQILGGVAEGALPLAGCEGVLLDALKVLACKEIRGGAQPRGDAEDEGPDQGGAAPGAAAAAAKGRLVSQLMKKNLMENVVPILIELKRCAP
jgi:hypothetical protein